MPVQFTEFVNKSSTKNAQSVRLLKNREFQKAKRSKESDCDRQNRLLQKREYMNKKRREESKLARQTRLDGAKMYQKRKRSVETDSERENQLKKKRIYRRSESSQNDYLTAFNISENGGIEEQSWAKANIQKFHKLMKYVVSQRTVCFEAWPLKFKPKAPYVCSRCSRDKKSPKKFSVENSLIPSSVPLELKDLTQVEEMLIARTLPIMRVYIKPGGQRGYSGHFINLPQNVTELATSLPRYPKDLAVIIVKVKGRDNTLKDVTVGKQKVHNALVWLIQYRPTETIHRVSSAFRVRARIFRASFERDGLQIALAIAFRVTRLLVRVVSITFRVDAIYYWRCAKLKSKQFLRSPIVTP